LHYGPRIRPKTGCDRHREVFIADEPVKYRRTAGEWYSRYIVKDDISGTLEIDDEIGAFCGPQEEWLERYARRD
jgi:hypothetical protein